jgi:PAS domain S-box-containing protein
VRATHSSARRLPPSQLKPALIAVAVCTAALITAFEAAQELLFPSIGIWQSHSITIAFTTLVAVVAAYVVSSRLTHLNQLLQSLIDRRNAYIAKLKESQAHNAAILRSSLDCIISMDEQGRIIEFNPAAERTFGLKREDVLGLPIAETIVPRSLRTAQTTEFIHCITGDDPCTLGHRIETTGFRADGSEFPLELGVVGIELPGPPKFTAFVRDLTEQKQLEQQLIRSQKLESIGRLAGGVAHDFNNLLTIIIGYACRLQEQVGAHEELARELKGIRKAADRAASLTSKLLAFSRRQVLQPSVLNLNAIVDETRTMLARVIPEPIEMVTVADPDLGSVNADRGQIEQVIVNLAVNARDAMPKGGRLTFETANVFLDELYSRQHIAVPPGEYVVLAVSDTGIGMDAATQERIFEPFFTTKEVGKGTGLGLSSVYGIVQQSGGHISVDSEPGRGTTFKIFLPRINVAAQPITQPKPPPNKQPVSTLHAGVLGRRGARLLG